MAFNDIVDKVFNRKDIKSDDIPDLDLYIDQIITLLETGLDDYKRKEDDKILTKTMINNYSKQGVIKSIKGKKYSKEHIIQMLMVFYMKNTLSIEEIKTVLQPVYTSMDNDDVSITKLYDEFIDIKNNEKDILKNTLVSFFEYGNYSLEDDASRLSIILGLIAISEYSKAVAQKIIDDYSK